MQPVGLTLQHEPCGGVPSESGGGFRFTLGSNVVTSCVSPAAPVYSTDRDPTFTAHFARVTLVRESAAVITTIPEISDLRRIFQVSDGGILSTSDTVDAGALSGELTVVAENLGGIVADYVLSVRSCPSHVELVPAAP